MPIGNKKPKVAAGTVPQGQGILICFLAIEATTFGKKKIFSQTQHRGAVYRRDRSCGKPPPQCNRSSRARAASAVDVEFLTATEFFDQITGSPQAAREAIQRLSQRLREADDRIVRDKRRSDRAHGMRKDADSQTAVQSVTNAYLAAKNPWLQRQLHARRSAVNRWPGVSCRRRAAAVAARPQAR